MLSLDKSQLLPTEGQVDDILWYPFLRKAIAHRKGRCCGVSKPRPPGARAAILESATDSYAGQHARIGNAQNDQNRCVNFWHMICRPRLAQSHYGQRWRLGQRSHGSGVGSERGTHDELC
jgi:hypothetical protein